MTNDKMKKIAFNELAESRRIALENAFALRESLRSNPEFDEIEKKIATEGIKLARLRVDNKATQSDEDGYTSLLKREKEVLSSLGYGDGIQPDFSCKKCEDTGFYHGSECACVQKRIQNIIMRKSANVALPSYKFDSLDFDTIADASQRKSLQATYVATEKMCEKFPLTKYNNLIISGPTGVGKSCLLSSIANRISERGFSVVYLTAFELGTRFLTYHTARLNERASAIADVLNCDALCVDDLGTEPVLKNVTVEYLLLVLSERTLHGKHTYFTTNLNADDILNRYGERVFSRMFDKSHSTAVLIPGEDLRVK